MKKFVLRILSATLCLLAIAVPGAVQFLDHGNYSGGYNPLAFCGQGVTNIGLVAGLTFSNCIWFCTSARGNGVARIENIQCTGDLVPSASGSIQSYYCTNTGTLTNAGALGTNQLWMDTTGFASNDVIVVRSFLNDWYQRCVITNCSTSNVFVHPLAAFPVSIGDVVYKETRGITLPLSGVTNYSWQSTTAPLNLYGRVGQPLLIDFCYSNSASMPLVSGSYLPARDR